MTESAPQRPLTSRHVAVIGAGAAGLVSARELRREGHTVVVFEREDRLGGTWIYTPETESDPIGLDPTRRVVHSSMYESLRTNLPREVMGFRDFPFVARGEGDPRRFPGHREVLLYLEDFAREFGVESSVRFETEVESVAMAESENRWRVRSKKRGDSVGLEELFEAVVVCNGHFSEPRVAQIPGVDAWPGKQCHSHSYRTPEPFRDQVVVIIGSSASSVDISREIEKVAKEVHVASRSVTNMEGVEKLPGSDNIRVHPMIRSAHVDKRVVFEDESVVFADIILHCTGYKYHFSFLDTNGLVTVDDNRVGPLYKHVFPPALAPALSFVGLPMKVFPFALFELQSKWIAGVLSNRIELPRESEMMKDVAAFYAKLEVSSVPKRYTHDLLKNPFEYEDWLVGECGCTEYEEWRKKIFSRVFEKLRTGSATYRDETDDEDLFSQAKQDFIKYLPKQKD